MDNLQSRRCLNDADGQNSVQPQLWDCDFGGNANQLWDVTGYS